MLYPVFSRASGPDAASRRVIVVGWRLPKEGGLPGRLRCMIFFRVLLTDSQVGHRLVFGHTQLLHTTSPAQLRQARHLRPKLGRIPEMRSLQTGNYRTRWFKVPY